MKEKVEGAVDDIKMSKFLATIRTDVPLDLDLEKLKLEKPNEEKLTKIFEELEFKTLANKILNKGKEVKRKVNQELDLFAVNEDNGQESAENSSFESLKTIAHEYKLIFVIIS